MIKPSYTKPVIVDFWADWCSPCLILAPILKQVAEEFEQALKVVKLEVDEGKNMKLAGQFKVRGFPTVILFKSGIECDRFSSAQSFSYIEGFLHPYL